MKNKDIIFLQVIIPLALLIFWPDKFYPISVTIAFLLNHTMALYTLENSTNDRMKSISVGIDALFTIITQIIYIISGYHYFKEFSILAILIHIMFMMINAIVFNFVFGSYMNRRK